MDTPPLKLKIEVEPSAINEKKTLNIEVLRGTNLVSQLKSMVITELGISETIYDVTFYMPAVQGSGRECLDCTDKEQSLESFFGSRLEKMMKLFAVFVRTRASSGQKKSQAPKQQQNKPSKRKSPMESNTAAPGHKSKMEGKGNRLCDSQEFDSSGNAATKMSRKSNNSICKGNDQRNEDALTWFVKFLPGTRQFQNACREARLVLDEDIKASSCIAAVQSGHFQLIENVGNDVGRVLGGKKQGGGVKQSSSLLKIRFPKGIQGSGDYEDEVELVECDRMCIATIYVEEFILKRNKQEVDHRLTPQSIASVSAQLFWLMVYHYCKKKGGEKPKSMDDVLMYHFPNRDWSHLNRNGRQRLESEKAKRNRLQKNGGSEECERPLLESLIPGNMLEGVIYKIARDEYSADSNPSKTLPAKKRSNSVQSFENWNPSVPDEFKFDEIKECIKVTISEETLVENYTRITMLHHKNWRQLADAVTFDLQAEIAKTCVERKIESPTLSQVQSWVDMAQEKSAEDIMAEVFMGVDGEGKPNPKANGAETILPLLKKTCTDTLMDFVGVWSHLPPDLILDYLGSPRGFRQSDAWRWVARAKSALDAHPWLQSNCRPICQGK